MIKKYFDYLDSLRKNITDRNAWLKMGIAISLFTVVLTPFLVNIILLVILMIATIVFLKKYLLMLIPILFLVLIADVTKNFRDIVVLGLSTLLLVLFFFRYQLKYKNYPLLPAPLMKTLALFFVVMLVSTLDSIHIIKGTEQIFRVSAFIIIFYLLTALINDFEKLKLILISLIIAGSVLSLSIIYDFAKSGFSLLTDDDAMLRLGGLFSNVNFVSAPIYVSVILSIVFYFYSNNGRLKKLYLVASIFNLIGLLLNNSRSSLLALIAASGVLLYFLKRKKFWFIALMILGSFAIVIMLTDLMHFLEIYLRLERMSSGRENFWTMAWNMFFDNPILGVGPASFKYEMYRYLPVHLGSWNEQRINQLFHIADFGHQHNFYLLLASEMGIFGLLAGLFLIFNFIKYGVASIDKLKVLNPSNAILCIACFAIGIGFFFRAFFESINILSYGWLSADLPFWLIFFLVVQLPNLSSVENSTNESLKPNF